MSWPLIAALMTVLITAEEEQRLVTALIDIADAVFVDIGKVFIRYNAG